MSISVQRTETKGRRLRGSPRDNVSCGDTELFRTRLEPCGAVWSLVLANYMVDRFTHRATASVAAAAAQDDCRSGCV